MKTLRPHLSQGLSLVEVLATVAVVGALAAVAVAMVAKGTIEGAREVRFVQEQKVLNSAVRAYLASGGDLTSAQNAGEVIAKLRTRATPEQQALIPGFSGGFLDPSIEFVMQTKEEAEIESARLFWNPANNCFDLVRSGAPGLVSIKAGTVARASHEQGQEMGTPVDLEDPPEYERRLVPFTYASKSTWIWDYADAPVTHAGGPSDFALPPPGDTLPPSTFIPGNPVISPPVVTTSSVPPTPTQRLPLAAPRFSIPAGRYPQGDFNLSLALNDPNPAGTAFLFYSLNYGNWEPYGGGSIDVPPDFSVKAQAIPVNPEVRDPSAVVEAIYEAYQSLYAMLLPPVIEFSKSQFQNTSDLIFVSLTNPNPAAVSELIYQLIPVPGGSGPTTSYQTYGTPFVVRAQDYPNGFGVRAIAKATAPEYVDSRPASRFASAEISLFGGHIDLDTSTTVARFGSGSTDAHTHDILKSGGTSISFFAIPDGSQIEIPEAVTDSSQRFRLTVVNGALSPGMNLVIHYDLNGTSRTLDVPAAVYGQFSDSELPVFSLGGAPGTAKLRDVRFTMAQDLLYQAGMIPTVTGDVRSNVPGKGGEWRNGALTLQAVAVNADGSPAYTLDPTLSNGTQGAAMSGMIWEAAVFWHWSGDSYDDVRNPYKPSDFNSIRLFLPK